MEQRLEVAECRAGATAFRMLVSNRRERIRAGTLATKEPETVRWIAERFRAGDALFDVGANVGIFTLLAAVQNPAGLVIAVEPMAATFARLCENIALNGLTNVRPYAVAIGARNGLAELQLASLEAASSMHSVGDGIFGEPVVMRTGVGVATIDALAAATVVPALMKIDVDGSEDDVLAGAAAVLRHPRLRSLLVEFNWRDGTPQPRRDEPLLQAGFRLESVGEQYERGDVRWQNAIYERASTAGAAEAGS